MKIFNTLTRTKEDFVPVQEGKASIYVCGPTTYNFIHAGNARPYVVFDTLRRHLSRKNFDITFVQNFTDIDDKIIQKANDEGITHTELAKRYIDEFFIDTDALNVQRASHYPRVTEEIEGIIDLTAHLIEKGFAYEVDGTVYFVSHKVADYGKLSKKNIEELEAGARVEVNSHKRNSSDFVLWKAAKPGEPSWNSPWGQGRPGWHIECSVMARKFLGTTVDIHAGGEDLCFPHHENEIAQSEAAYDEHFVNYWMHNGMLLVDNQKMAKSEGNFFLVRDVAGKFGYDVLRFFLLSVHYRSPLNFSEELMQAAANGLERIKNCRRELVDANSTGNDPQGAFMADFDAALDDDLNTANAISIIFDMVKHVNILLREKTSVGGYLAMLDQMCDVLGIKFEDGADIDTVRIEELIEQRNQAKRDKDFARSDAIRDELLAMGITIKDTREGTKWHLTSS